jgi:16S rRNA (adenine1518-N6/adenine1519-N6)-dimethyltransferase
VTPGDRRVADDTATTDQGGVHAERGRDPGTPDRGAPGGQAASLTAPSKVAALLRRHGLTPDRGFSQNFLVDAAVLSAVVDAAAIGPEDTVFEVGPGLGVLTRALAARARRVVSVELDRRLLDVLSETLQGLANVEVVQGDAARFDYAALEPGALLVANLPYSVATAVVARALESDRFVRLVFLVQREVADRLTASPGTPAYGALTLFVQHFGRARSLRRVAPGAFLPPPKVTSAVVRIDVRPDAVPDPELFALVRTAFAHRRKTLAKNLILAGFEREPVAAALARAGCDPHVRAEALDLAAFRRLRDELPERTDRR